MGHCVPNHRQPDCLFNSLTGNHSYVILSCMNHPVLWSGNELIIFTWWRHQMETFSALLALCAGNSPVPVNSPHKGQWRGALMFTLICARINNWVNNREAGDLRRHRGHYDFNVMISYKHRSVMSAYMPYHPQADTDPQIKVVKWVSRLKFHEFLVMWAILLFVWVWIHAVMWKELK